METLIDKLSRKEKKVLNYFLEHPTKEIHLRALSKEIDVSHTWVEKTVEKLRSEDLVEVNMPYNLKQIKAQRENPLFKAIKRYRNILKLHDLTCYLEEEYNHPEAIVVFGSYAQGEDIEKSDIDIAVITKADGEVDLTKFEQKLGRDISLKVIEEPTEEFKTSLINGITLRGFLS